MAVDAGKLHEFSGRFVADLGAIFAVGNAVIGHRPAESGSLLSGGTGIEWRHRRRARHARRAGDVLLGVALQASLMAECFAGGAGDAEGRVGVSELVGAAPVSDDAIDGDFGLCSTGRSSCGRCPERHRVSSHLKLSLQGITGGELPRFIK